MKVPVCGATGKGCVGVNVNKVDIAADAVIEVAVILGTFNRFAVLLKLNTESLYNDVAHDNTPSPK